MRVVVDGNIFTDIGDSFFSGSVQSVTGPLTLQAGKESFNWRIVPAIPFSTHTADHAEPLEQFLIFVAGVLATSDALMFVKWQ